MDTAVLTDKLRPQLLRHVWSKWSQQLEEIQGNLTDQTGIHIFIILELIELINQLHNRTDGCIEHETVTNVLCNLLDGNMKNATQFLLSIRENLLVIFVTSRLNLILKLADNTPYAIQEAE